MKNPSSSMVAGLLAAILLMPVLRAGSVTGQVVGPAGAGVVGVNVDFVAGGSVIQSGATAAGGFFNILVPDGTYDVEFHPPTTFAPVLRQGVVVTTTTNMGVIRLATGYVLSGSVTTNSGAPVAGANIDVYDEATGLKLFTPSDGVNSLGNFSVVVPAGTFRVRAKPPTGQLLVAQELSGVVVTGPTNVGTMRLPPGVLVTGTVVEAGSGTRLANVDLDAEDAITGTKIVTPGDQTNASGVFQLVLPTGLYHLSFAPPPAGNHLGRQRFNVAINGFTNIGTTTLERGLVVSGTVQEQGGAPVVGADVDVDTVPGNVKVYTPHDNTDAAGKFRVVVPAGTYTVTVEPPVALGLVGARRTPVSVTANQTLPLFSLAAGVALMGTLTAHSGGPEYNADIDVVDPNTGVELPTAGDRTDSAGSFRVIVPSGSWDVRFQTRKGSLSRVETLAGVSVTGPTTRNHQLAKVPIGVYLGTTGIPTVPQGGPLLVTLAFFNPNATAQSGNASLAVIDPDGNTTFLLQSLALTLPPGTVGLGINVPLPVLPAIPAHLGKPFRMEVRFDEPGTGAELDRDHVTYLVQ